ncbi:MAG: CPBP family intramembrane metalloprotease [Bacteroidales bacterium]|nr:MAG: CPBP family intramembrane metalloprotease [Bacteroidales bacterium]
MELTLFITCCAVFFVYFFVRSNSKFLIFSFLIAVTSIVNLYQNQCDIFLKRHYPLFFFFSAILFGLLYIFNFEGINVYNFIFTPLLVLPQIFMGLILGYIRVIYGFKYGVLLHAIVNTSILLI